MPIPSQKRMKRTRYQRLVEDRKAEKRKNYRKKPVTITQQPSKKRNCYAGRCTWEWVTGPDKGKKYNQPVSLPYPFSMKLRGKDLVILPNDGDEFVWGEGKAEEVRREARRAKLPPMPPEKAKRVKSLLDMLRERLEALVAERGPRDAGKAFARGFVIAHNRMRNKKAKSALAKLYATVLKNSNRAAFLSFAAHLRRSSSMNKKIKAKANFLSAFHHFVVAGGDFGENTLEQLVAMSAESMFSEGVAKDILSPLFRAVDVSQAVKRAAADYEDVAEKVLSEVSVSDEVVDEAMSNDAPYLMFMTQEGHGVGINDGDLDIEGLDLSALRDKLYNHTHLGSAYVTLRNAIEENAFEAGEEIIEELIDHANDAISEALDEREEYEKDPDGPSADSLFEFLGDQITYTYNSLEDFAEKEVTDRINGDLAEAVADAFAAGHDERDIFKAIQDVGEVEWVDGYRRERGFSLAVSSDEVELEVDADGLVLPRVGDIKDVTAGEAMQLAKQFDMEEGLDFEVDKRGLVTDSRDLNGYFNFDVDPSKLRKKLRLK